MSARIIYTAIFNGYDELASITLPAGWRAICFTDTDIIAKGWEIIKMEPYPKAYRHIKTCPHLFLPEHSISLWVDGNLMPKMPLNHIVNGKEGYVLMTHPSRNSVFKEAKRCIELKKDDEDTINAQMARYRKERYPDHPTKNGLVATGVIIRSGDFSKFSEMWWNEISRGSVRDQLSWNYCQWKTGLKYKTFPFLMGFNKVIHASKR